MAALPSQRIEAFNFPTGRVIGGKYEIEAKLGGGWEGEVYRVVEKRTGVRRAAKVFYPHRNERDRAVTFYAKKLDRLRHCAMVIHYVHSETIRYRSQPITCLISEFVEGQLLSDFVTQRPGKRLPLFEALHLTYTLARGLQEIHQVPEYHGDLHAGNVLVRREGIFFDLKIVDFYHWGAPTRAHVRDDVADLIRLLYDALGGKRHYPSQPPVVRDIVRGLRRDLIAERFPTARHLREHLEQFAWE